MYCRVACWFCFSDCNLVNVFNTQIAALSASSSGTTASPLQGFPTLVSNLHTDVTLDDVMVSVADM